MYFHVPQRKQKAMIIVIMNIHLEFMFFPVYNHSCDLLVHENQNGDQQSWDSSCKVHPPGVSSKWWNKPTTVWTCWLEEEKKQTILIHKTNNINTYLVQNHWGRHTFIIGGPTYWKMEMLYWQVEQRLFTQNFPTEIIFKAIF